MTRSSVAAGDPVVLGVASDVAVLAGLIEGLRIDTANNAAAAGQLLAVVNSLDTATKLRQEEKAKNRDNLSCW